MLKKMKRPDLYINYGVWVFLPNSNELVKRKIIGIKVGYTWSCDFYVESVCLLNVGWFSPEEVYMTRKEAFKEGVKKLQTLLKESQDELEWQERNTEHLLRGYKNKVTCKTRDLKDMLEIYDHFLEKMGVDKVERDQIKFFSSLGFKKVE